MLATRVLPPIVRPSSPPLPAPVATFFHVPRRYVRSNMQVGDTPIRSLTDGVKPSCSLRKSSRVQDARSMPTSGPMSRTNEEEIPSPVQTSPRSHRKRIAPIEESVHGEEYVDNSSPTDARSPQSTGSGEQSPHVCLCQPEPKIPRPRNGESSLSLSAGGFSAKSGVTWTEQRHVCG